MISTNSKLETPRYSITWTRAQYGAKPIWKMDIWWALIEKSGIIIIKNAKKINYFQQLSNKLKLIYNHIYGFYSLKFSRIMIVIDDILNHDFILIYLYFKLYVMCKLFVRFLFYNNFYLILTSKKLNCSP